jgi:16S rRNA (cytosine1402-N4)-methyltransferase
VHQPVLLDEVLFNLNVLPNGIYMDATFGRGGHAAAILHQLNNQGRLIALDRDPDARDASKEYELDQRFSFYWDSFLNIKMIAKQAWVLGKVNGILIDLGVSSPQLMDPERGFSFMKDGPLDMRMDPTQGISAAQWLNQADRDEITHVLRTYGEEPYAKRISNAIIETRKKQSITTTGQLVHIICRARPRNRHKHPATLAFQAIRIWINRELEHLKVCLQASLDVLAVGGRLLVISFHSLEDRIVKQFIRQQSQTPYELARIPIQIKPRLKKIGAAIKPSKKEIVKNPRARSAILRIAEKLL